MAVHFYDRFHSEENLFNMKYTLESGIFLNMAHFGQTQSVGQYLIGLGEFMNSDHVTSRPPNEHPELAQAYKEQYASTIDNQAPQDLYRIWYICRLAFYNPTHQEITELGQGNYYNLLTGCIWNQQPTWKWAVNVERWLVKIGNKFITDRERGQRWNEDQKLQYVLNDYNMEINGHNQLDKADISYVCQQASSQNRNPGINEHMVRLQAESHRVSRGFWQSSWQFLVEACKYTTSITQ